MDQFIAGMPQAAVAAPPAYRDQQSASGAADTGGQSFENYVAKAGQAEDAADTQSFKTASPSAEGLPQGVTDSGEVRIRLALLKQSQKGVAPEEGQDSQAEKALAKMLAAAKQMAQTSGAESAQAAGATQQAAASPSEELSVLLGLVPSKESSAKSMKKDAADDESADGTDEKSAVVGDKKSEILLPSGHENAAATKGNEAARGKDDLATEAVRLVSADGRGRPVDISLSTTDREGVTDVDKRSGSAKFDTATVIEARRYLGFSQESNTQTLTGAIKSDQTWTEALSHVNRAGLSLEGDTVKEVNTLKLQMNPGDLGNMVASLKLKGDELTVVVRVETIEAYRHLSADQDGIVKALQDQGFSIDKVSVQLNAPERTQADSDRELGRQDQGQRGDEGNQPSDRNHNARQGDQNPWTRDEDLGISKAADGRTDAPRAGDIYL